ncbi:MAG TPA: acyl carrier protein [Planctomycetaceae bacterium]|nr:acyl carrier protein [Planctomycetaceae bacterium]
MIQSLNSLLTEIRPEAEFDKSQDFFSDGFLDSFDLITFVAALDRKYAISIEGTDILPEHFCNFDAIRSLLQKYGVAE